MFDVAIVGAGPSGSRAAFQLAQRGYRVVVLDQHAAPGQKGCCTGIISQKCLQQFSIPDKLVYRHLKSARVFSPALIDIPIALEHPQAAIIDRQRFDVWLAETAESQGAVYQMGCRVETIELLKQGAEISYLNQGILHKLSTQVVILACGFSARLVRQVGLRPSAYQVTGVQAVVESDYSREIEVYFNQKLAPGFFAWLAPTQPGQALAGLMTRDRPGWHLRSWLAELAAQGKIKSADVTLKYAGIPLNPVSSAVKNRLLVVGDAAGQVKPSTGGGIYLGMVCADIAAETVERSFKAGDFSEQSLKAYDRAWRELLLAELKKEYLARKAYQLLSDRQIDGIFNSLRVNGVVDSLLHEEYSSFDNHGELLLKAFKISLVSQAKRFSRFFMPNGSQQ